MYIKDGIDVTFETTPYHIGLVSGAGRINTQILDSMIPGGGDTQTSFGIVGVANDSDNDAPIIGVYGYGRGRGGGGIPYGIGGLFSASQQYTAAGISAGIWVESVTGGAHKYGLYVKGGDKNYFAGNVGIGTTSPSDEGGTSYKLYVSGETYLGLMPNHQQEGKLILGRSGGTLRNHEIKAYNSSTQANNYLTFAVHNGTHDGVTNYATDVLTLKGNGNVGIGTTNPGRKLTVNGIIHAGTALIGPYGNGNGAGLYAHEGTVILYFDASGNSHRWDNDALIKSFIIEHPLDEEKYLIHGTLEGPEGAVYYRGTSQLKNGKAEITLPDYFEALTRKQGRTILLTNIDGFDKLAVKKINNHKINNGKCIVFSDNIDSNQEFDWEVKAIRSDVSPLNVEPYKKDINVRGEGPYKYTIK